MHWLFLGSPPTVARTPGRKAVITWTGRPLIFGGAGFPVGNQHLDEHRHLAWSLKRLKEATGDDIQTSINVIGSQLGHNSPKVFENRAVELLHDSHSNDIHRKFVSQRVHNLPLSSNCPFVSQLVSPNLDSGITPQLGIIARRHVFQRNQRAFQEHASQFSVSKMPEKRYVCFLFLPTSF